MTLDQFFPFWKELTPAQQETFTRFVTRRSVKKGTILHNGSEDCVGLFIVEEGQLRAYIVSEEGKEISLYRLLPWDMCLFSASCMMNSIQFDVTVIAEQDSEILHIPTAVYQGMMKESASVANFTNEIMASRFSDVMWLMDQILYKRMDSRLAALLLEESQLSQTSQLKLTHEAAARYLGSAREVITRMLKYFQTEGIVSLSRGGIAITDSEKLAALAKDSIR